MDTIALPVVDSSSQEKQQESNIPKKLTGFALHPENINREGLNRKEWTFKQILKDALEKERDVKNKLGVVTGRKQVNQIVVEALLAKAINERDVQAIKEIFDRTEGKIPQAIKAEHSGEVTLSFHSSLKQEQHGGT